MVETKSTGERHSTHLRFKESPVHRPQAVDPSKTQTFGLVSTEIQRRPEAAVVGLVP